ncbi:hypothetical protein HGRIS_002384 [Hohenbuehelia grisea]|uniref:FeS cluster biogenesis domain-containing protein n=1 Tax=Hohenbuehelia grisea TaxID=104357 RepID=A0ABR3JLQ1_9AGAR
MSSNRIAAALLQRASRNFATSSGTSHAHLRSWYNVQQRRHLSTTLCRRAAAPAVPPAKSTVLLTSPTQHDIDEQELDAELIPPQNAKLGITDRAAEQLRAISTRERDPEAALRITVESGGCHGYQYKMALATSREPDD